MVVKAKKFDKLMTAAEMSEMTGKRVGYLGFSSHQLEMQRNGWLQARYYSDDGSDTVRDFLRFNSVFEINPFEIGVSRSREKRFYRAQYRHIVELFSLQDLLPRSFVSLSNGEMRRTLLARELLKDPEVLVLDDPFGGLDPWQCERFQAIIADLENKGVEVIVRVDHPKSSHGKWTKPGIANQCKSVNPAVVFDSITIKIGKRTLFKDFSWVVGRGERWVLRGHNGSGKTTLMALITGDSPLAYGVNVTVLGQKREVGAYLEPIRKKIAMVSPEMQAYMDKGPEELLDAALARKPELLILDEPCMNLDLGRANRLCKKVSSWLRRHPKVTAICVAHRPEHVPECFDREMNLDEL